jgi:hypothetical protein
MEPLVIPLLKMENGNGGVRVRAAFNNMTIRGGTNYTITWIKYDARLAANDKDIFIVNFTGCIWNTYYKDNKTSRCLRTAP